MKRTNESLLEDISRSSLKTTLLSKGWIVKDIWERDIGLDMEVEITKAGKVTDNKFWLQVKAIEKKKETLEIISLQIKTKHIKYYEGCKLPVVIVFGIKKSDNNFDFYFLFAQKYIREVLSVDKPNWRKQKTIMVKFNSKLELENIEDLERIAMEEDIYIAAQQLNIQPTGLQYWLDGIPQSDNKELKEHISRAFRYILNSKYDAAIDEFEAILRVCTLFPREKMSILLNLGNAYYSLSQSNNALKNYKAILELSKKITEEDVWKGKVAALGNMGLILKDKGDFDNALKYLKEALKIHREIGDKQGESSVLSNIGLIYSAKGDFDNAIKYHQAALRIAQEIGYQQGESFALGNIGLIYLAKGYLDNALKYLKDALKIHREIRDKQGEANQLGIIGLIYSVKGDFDNAMKYHQAGLKIAQKIGDKKREAEHLGNIGLIYSSKGDVHNGLKYLKDALGIFDKLNLFAEQDVFKRAIDLAELSHLLDEERRDYFS